MVDSKIIFPIVFKPKWFVLDEHQIWIDYGIPNPSKKKHFQNCDSQTLENFFQQNHKASITMNSFCHSYLLNFKLMVQTNVKTSTERPIWRKINKYSKLESMEWFHQDEHLSWRKMNFNSETNIDEAYLKYPNNTYSFTFRSKCVSIDFQKMLITDLKINVSTPVRRTGICFSSHEPKVSVSQKLKFIWQYIFYKNVWVNFKEYSSSTDDSSIIDLTFEKIENAFSEQHSGEVSIVHNNVTYTLNFDALTIEDTSSCEIKKIRCLRVHQKMQIRNTDCKILTDNSIPHYWAPMPDSQDTIYVHMSEYSEEFLTCLLALYKYLPTFAIVKLERIQNLFSMKSYLSKMNLILNKNKREILNEQLLFRGTKNVNLKNICEKNVDLRSYGTNPDNSYGLGCYFSSE